MMLQNKREMKIFSIVCMVWSLATLIVLLKREELLSLKEYVFFYWRGFSGIGTPLLWWICVQFPVFGGVIFFLRKWKTVAFYIRLKKGETVAISFFVLKTITIASIYYAINVCVLIGGLSASCFFRETMTCFNSCDLFSIVQLYVMLSLNGIVYVLTVICGYILALNEYLSFVIVLCGHVVINIISSNVAILSPYIWTVSGNLLAMGLDIHSVHSFIGSCIWTAILLMFIRIFLMKKSERFWG